MSDATDNDELYIASSRETFKFAVGKPLVFEARAKITEAIQPGQVHILHAWEPYQFRGGRCHQSLAPSPFKITQLVGDYGHLHWAYAHFEPGQVDRDTRVDLALLEEQA